MCLSEGGGKASSTHLVGPLCSLVWQNKKRTSFSACENAYLADIVVVLVFQSSLDGGGRRLGIIIIGVV
jgi:hypothetical protein